MLSVLRAEMINWPVVDHFVPFIWCVERRGLSYENQLLDVKLSITDSSLLTRSIS